MIAKKAFIYQPCGKKTGSPCLERSKKLPYQG